MAKSKEERLAAARDKVKKLKDATKTKARTDRMDWKPKALVYLHPDTDIHERRRVWFSKEVDEKDDAKDKKKGKGKGKGKGKKKGTRIVTIPFNVPEDPECDPFYLLRKALKADEDIDADEVILVVGSGRDKVEYRKGDILNWDDFDYKKSLYPQSDFACAAIMVENKDGDVVDKFKVETLAGAKTLGKEIRKEIEAEVDENGDEKGNPFFRPYPFRIEYDGTASGTDMYSARARPAYELPKEVAELFEQDAPDLSDEIKVDDGEAIHSMLTNALVYDLEIPEPKDAVFKDKDADQVEDPPEKDEDPEPATDAAQEPVEPVEPAEEDEVEKAERLLAEAKEKKEAEKAAKVEAAKKKKAAEAAKKKKAAEAEEDEVAKAERLLAEAKAKKAADKKAADKPKTTGRKKIADKDADPPKDDVEVPEGYDDPGPRPDDDNVNWWPDRAKGELYDLCPKCDRPVREDDVKCPHKDCGVEYAPADGGF